MSKVKSHTDVEVGDKIVVTMIDGVVLESPHYATVTDIYAGQFDFSPRSFYGDTLFLGEELASGYDEWRSADELPSETQYDDEALSPSYSDAVKAGMSFADYTGVNITEESLDFEPKEEEVLRGITAESLNFEEATKSDAVNHPSHYSRYSREVIESIKGLCTPEEFRGYLKGNIIKYSARYPDKGGVQDIDKLAKYTQFLKEFEIEMEGE